MKQVLILGDSLTQYGYDIGQHGFVAQLCDWLQAKRLVNAIGCSGYTTLSYLCLLPTILKDQYPNNTHLQVDTVIIFLGTNDSVLQGEPQHVTLAQFKQYITTITEKVATHFPNLKTKLFLTPCFFDEYQYNSNPTIIRRNNKHTRLYVDVITNTLRHDWTIMNLFTETQKDHLYSTIYCDGLHFNQNGNDLVFKLIRLHLSKLMPELNIPGPTLWPDWKTLPPMTAGEDLIKRYFDDYD